MMMMMIDDGDDGRRSHMKIKINIILSSPPGLKNREVQLENNKSDSSLSPKPYSVKM